MANGDGPTFSCSGCANFQAEAADPTRKLVRRGAWFLLPQDPFPAGTWLNARDLDDEPHVLEADGIVTSPMGSLVILAVQSDVIRARHEQPGDMWCKDAEAPAVKPSQELRIPRRDLYSPSGHLLIAPKYMKGC